jgi:clan AA aspartic protease
MTGYVDDARRALLEVPVQNRANSRETTITVWIDTAFTGFFVFSKALISSLDLQQISTTEAILADGSKVSLEAYVCYVNWFGQLRAAQVVANEGQFPLLGTELLADRILTISYERRQVSLM